MIKRKLLLFLIVILICFPTFSQIPIWKKIKPVNYKRVDVEKILGNNGEKGYLVKYKTNEGTFFIKYSDGNCVTKWKEEWNSKAPELSPLKEGTLLIDWNLPEWTVEKVDFTPKKPLPITSLGINLKRLNKKIIPNYDTPATNQYIDEINGIGYDVEFYYERVGKNRQRRVNVVTAIELFPAPKYKNLLCEKEK